MRIYAQATKLQKEITPAGLFDSDSFFGFSSRFFFPLAAPVAYLD
jgi:hypothetical protein